MRTAVFVSGRGSNLKALLDENPLSNFYVFSNKKNSPQAFYWARRRGIFSELVVLDKQDDWKSFAAKLNELGIEKVFLLGFMKIVPQIFLELLNAQCVNLHPSLLPDFPGLKSIEKTFKAKKSMGCTIHEVSEFVDAGEIYLQKPVNVPSLNFKIFQEQVHQAEQDVVSKYCEMSLFSMEVG